MGSAERNNSTKLEGGTRIRENSGCVENHLTFTTSLYEAFIRGIGSAARLAGEDSFDDRQEASPFYFAAASRLLSSRFSGDPTMNSLSSTRPADLCAVIKTVSATFDQHFSRSERIFRKLMKPGAGLFTLLMLVFVHWQGCRNDESVAAPPEVSPVIDMLNGILLVSYDNPSAAERGQICIINPDGTDFRQLTKSTDTLSFVSATWSPDGSQIVVTIRDASSIPQCFIFDVPGGGCRQVTHFDLTSGTITSPMVYEWESNDELLTCVRNYSSGTLWFEFWRMDLFGAFTRRIFEEKGSYLLMPDAHGALTVCSYSRPGGTSGLLGFYDVDSTMQSLREELIDDEYGQSYGIPKLSSDGKNLCFTIKSSSESKVFVKNLETKSERMIYSAPAVSVCDWR